MEPWQWPEDEWRRRVDQVRAGRSLKPERWPGGPAARLRCRSIATTRPTSCATAATSIGRMSWGQYGNRVGVPRILATLSKADVRATFFVPAVTALLHPDEQRRVIADGHEIGLHGWIHEVNSSLREADERELHLRAADTIERITGVRAVGMRTPSWDFRRQHSRSSASSA